MSEPLSVEFADPASGIRAWVGRGLPGLGEGEAAALLCDADGPLIAAVGAKAEAEVTEAGARAACSSDRASVSFEVTPELEAGPLTAGRAEVEFGAGAEKRRLSCAGGYGALAADGEASVVRTLVALRSDGSPLALRARRLQGAEHGAEEVEAWIAEAEELEPRRIDEPLLSTQYEPGGAPSRAGLELWVGAEDPVPIRGAGTRRCGAELALEGWRLEAAFFDWIVEGIEGAGSYMLWRRGDG